MFTKTAAALAVATLGFTGLAVTAPAAQASNECVSRTEYQRVRPGWPKARVHNLFDVAGVRDSWSSSGGYTDEWRSYRYCGGGDVSINYDNYSDNRRGLRVYSKSLYVW